MDALPERAAVVIVGGGLAGAATAWWLARRGVTDVAVVEREDLLGLHASGRNAGMCRQIAEDDRWTELCVRGAAFLASPPDGFAPRPVLAVTGSYLVGDEDTVAALRARGLRAGVACARVADAPIFAAPAALFCERDGIIDVTTLLHGFVGGARRAGVKFVVNAEVESIRDRVVTTARGAVRADVVAIAAGAWSGVVGDAAGARDHAFTPVKRHLFFLAQGDTFAPGEPFVWRVGANECYVRNGADGLIASACDATPTPPGDVRVDPALRERLGDLLAPTAFANRAVTAQWACQRTYAPEGPPRIRFDRDVPWLFWIAGLGGHGATSCAAIGEEAARILCR